jgi:membrane-bound lytic murein transglycosylase B
LEYPGVTVRLRATLALAAAVLVTAVAHGQESAPSWSYLVDKLAADGIDRERATRLFADPRMPPFTGLDFSLVAHEPRALYRGFLRGPSLAAARSCRRAHAASFEAAERTTGVPAEVIAAIIHVETGCGRNTGSSPIAYRLARLAMANEPTNLGRNIDRLASPSSELAWRVRERARYLEDTFYPEVRALFELGDRLHVDPLTLEGSASGALGVPQFLPTNYLRYGTDGDDDGRVDLFDIADAAASCGRYLVAHGWRAGLSEPGRRQVIWRYNRSDAYVDAVLAIARSMAGPPAVTIARGTVGRPTRRTTKPGTKPQKRPARSVVAAATAD